MDILLKPGDIFLTNSNSIISKFINMVQNWWSLDGKSIYTHAGIILDETGKTFEAKFQGVVNANLDDIKDKPLLIARHQYMTPSVFENAFDRIKYQEGLMYPFHRLFLHLIPPLAKIFANDRAVCSEIVGQLLYHAEFLYYWKGITPDDLHDMFTHWRDYEIIFERNVD